MIEFVINNQTTIAWILGIIIVPGFFVWWQIYQSKKTAIQSGSFKKPILELNAVFAYFRDNSTLDIFVGLDTSDRFRFTILHVPFYFNNKGSKTAEDVRCTLDFPANSNLPIENLSLKTANPKQRFLARAENRTSIHYNLGDIHPQSCINHYELLRIKPQNIKIPESFSVTMQAKDELPFTVDINLYVVNAVKLKPLWEYVFEIGYTRYKTIDFNYIMAIPNSKIVKMEIGKYQDCIIKKSLIPITTKKHTDITFIPKPNQTDELL